MQKMQIKWVLPKQTKSFVMVPSAPLELYLSSSTIKHISLFWLLPEELILRKSSSDDIHV